MAKLSPQGKVMRVTRLLFGLRMRPVAAALVAHGFDRATIDEGFALLRSVMLSDVKGADDLVSGADHDARRNAWMHRWFPILEATLKRHHPEVAKRLFMSVEKGDLKAFGQGHSFVSGYDELKPSAPARRLMHARGLRDAHVSELRALYDLPDAKQIIKWPPEDFTEAEKSLWSWYLEWSAIVRARVKDKRVLRELGFGGAHDEGD